MANNTIDLINLDPDTAKSSLKQFLKGQTTFRSYDFEGSNMNEILSLLGTNTFKLSFLYNMINAESWLDSAQLRSSVISHAKDLAYLPKSTKSAKAIINLTIPTDGLINIISIPKGTTFSGRAGIQSFNFSTENTELFTSITGTFQVENLIIYEGIYLSDTFVMDTSNPTQRFIITNKNVDINSITIIVSENSGAVSYEYKYTSSLLGILPNSLSYFLQCTENEQYEILFGNNLFGREPQNGAIITITYRVSSGTDANGVESFVLNRDVTQGHLTGQVDVETVQNAIGGDKEEDIENIRFMAPRYFETQERGVNEIDYENLMLQNFSEIQAVAAFGGETQNPPQYGSVFISVVLRNVLGLPDSKKQEYFAFMKSRSLMTPVFITPSILYYRIDSIINYNINQTTLLPHDISTIVLAEIVQYNDINFENFKVILRYSRLISLIDNTHSSIISNETDIYVYKKISPVPNLIQNINIQFGLSIFKNYPPIPSNHNISEVNSVWSTEFIYQNKKVFLEDDSLGNIRIMTIINNIKSSIITIGTINYTTGEIQLIGINIQSYQNGSIKIYAKIAEKDIEVTGNNILTLEPDEVNITIISARE